MNPFLPALLGKPLEMVSAEESEESRQQHHFRTDHLRANLGKRAVSGGILTTISQAVRFGLYMALTIILARLLSPQDFGLVAMALALMTVLHMFRDAGLSTATIQQEKITHSQVSNLFWANVVIGLLCTAVAVGLAPLMAWYYHDGRLRGITASLALTLLAGGIAVQHIAILNRQMRFGALACIDVGSMLISLITAVVMGACNYGYWALVGSQLAQAFSELVLAWTFTGWRPQMARRNVGTRSMLNFGASVTFAMLLRRITSNADSFLLGRYAGAYGLGLYSRALALVMRPLDQFLVPFDKVFVPVLSRLQDQSERYRRTFLQIHGAIALVSFPIAGLLVGLAKPIVLILLGQKWIEVVPLFAALAFTALYYPVACSCMWLLTTQRRNTEIVTSGLIISVISILSVVAGLAFGPFGVAVSVSLFGILVRLPFQYFITGRQGPVTTRAMWTVFLKHLPFWFVVTAAAYAPQMLFSILNPFAHAAIGSAAGVIAAALLAGSVPAYRRDVREMVEMARRLKKNRSSAQAE
jgi:O-antigen/teichoic acid export membrane protein